MVILLCRLPLYVVRIISLAITKAAMFIPRAIQAEAPSACTPQTAVCVMMMSHVKDEPDGRPKVTETNQISMDAD